MQLVHNEDHFWTFVNKVMKPLVPGEVYFISLSARKKYLTEEERQFYDLGRTEMFGRTLGYGDWKYTMEKLAANLRYKTTKAGFPYPQKCLVVYMNINPSSSIKACGEFSKKVIEVQNEFMKSYLNGKQPNLDTLNKGDRLLLNYFQKFSGTRHYVDVDVDAGDDILETFVRQLMDSGTEHHVIKTRGGWHVLIDRESRNTTKFPIHEVVRPLDKIAKKYGGEVIINGNAMCPIPGTLQANTLVELIY